MVAPVSWYLSAWMKTTNLVLVFTKVCQLIRRPYVFCHLAWGTSSYSFVLLLTTSVSLLKFYSSWEVWIFCSPMSQGMSGLMPLLYGHLLHWRCKKKYSSWYWWRKICIFCSSMLDVCVWEIIPWKAFLTTAETCPSSMNKLVLTGFYPLWRRDTGSRQIIASQKLRACYATSPVCWAVVCLLS